MADEFTVHVTRSAVRLRRHWVSDRPWNLAEIAVGLLPDSPPRRGGGTNAGVPGRSTAGRVIREWSQRSRNNMRWEFSGLAWEDLGRRPAMLSLTYPGDWRSWASSGPEIRKHIERFKVRWLRRWGEPIRGVWVREFQGRGAPHWHLYVGLSDAVSDEDYDQLVRRTIRRKRLEREVGKYEARRRCGLLRGEFAQWLLAAWSKSVGTTPGSAHAKFGADVAPFFWGATVAEAAAGNVNWGRIADYFWRESGKWGQKTAPPDFTSPGRAWGRWGVEVRVSEAQLSKAVAMELRRVLWQVYRRRPSVVRRNKGKVAKPRGVDGLTVYELDRDTVIRLLRWAEDTAAWKAAVRRSGVDDAWTSAA